MIESKDINIGNKFIGKMNNHVMTIYDIYKDQRGYTWIRTIDEKGNCNCDLIVMDCTLLQELVDKATPKKLDMMRIKKYDGYDIGICQCGKTIERSLDDDIKYCPKCGQAIDWSDEK